MTGSGTYSAATTDTTSCGPIASTASPGTWRSSARIAPSSDPPGLTRGTCYRPTPSSSASPATRRRLVCASLPNAPRWWSATSGPTASSPGAATGRSRLPYRPATPQRSRRGCSGSPSMPKCCRRRRFATTSSAGCAPSPNRRAGDGSRRRRRPNGETVSSGPRRSERAAESRLSRLLVMLPWLMERREVPLAEVAATFRMTPAEVEAELELAAMCGVPPFVDELIDVFIDDETVFVGVPRLFTKPLRLTAPEGFALVTAGRAAMQLPAPIRRVLSDAASPSWQRLSVRTLTTPPWWSTSPRHRWSRSSWRRPNGSNGSAFVTGRRRATRRRTASSHPVASSTSAASGTSPATITDPVSTAHSASTAWNPSSTREFSTTSVTTAHRTPRSPGQRTDRCRGSPSASGHRHDGSSRSTQSTRRQNVATGRSRPVLRSSASVGSSGCCCAPEPTPKSSSRPRGGISDAAAAARLLRHYE